MLRISIERAVLADADVLGSAYRRIIAVVANAAGLILRRRLGVPGDAGMAVNPATSGGVGARIAFQHDVSLGYGILVCYGGRCEHGDRD
jgi:hypothetical protein